MPLSALSPGISALALTITMGLSIMASPRTAEAQGPLRSPEVSADNRVTFRFRAPNAKEVFLTREGAPRLSMQKDERGVWSVRTEPLEPDFYGYSFVADGVGYIDPVNPLMKPNLLNTQSMVHVPGPSTLPWEVNEVPHGVVHHHFYKSGVVGDSRDYFVYTPPNYGATGSERYPVLYLLHGFSDDASGWTAVGRAHVILDNLIAQGKAKPMVIVMTLGYGAPEIVRPGAGPRPPDLWQRNVSKFAEALLTEVAPQVDKSYRVKTDRGSRAIAGLSMGGAESLMTGLNHIDKFAWVGAFSSGGINEEYAKAFPALNSSANSRLKLLWIACGTEDGLLAANRKFIAYLNQKGVKHDAIETPGAHTWMVWRRNLATFAPLLFQESRSANR